MTVIQSYFGFEIQDKEYIVTGKSKVHQVATIVRNVFEIEDFDYNLQLFL